MGIGRQNANIPPRQGIKRGDGTVFVMHFVDLINEIRRQFTQGQGDFRQFLVPHIHQTLKGAGPEIGLQRHAGGRRPAGGGINLVYGDGIEGDRGLDLAWRIVLHHPQPIIQ